MGISLWMKRNERNKLKVKKNPSKDEWVKTGTNTKTKSTKSTNWRVKKNEKTTNSLVESKKKKKKKDSMDALLIGHSLEQKTKQVREKKNYIIQYYMNLPGSVCNFNGSRRSSLGGNESTDSSSFWKTAPEMTW